MENCLSREGAIQVDEVSGSRGLKIVDERESEPGLFTYTADVAVKRVSTALDNFIYTREGRRGRGGEGKDVKFLQHPKNVRVYRRNRWCFCTEFRYFWWGKTS